MPKWLFPSVGSLKLEETDLKHWLVLLHGMEASADPSELSSCRCSLRLSNAVFIKNCHKSVAVHLLCKTISTNLTATSVHFSVQSSKGPGALLWTGWLGMFTGPIIPECIGSATTPLTGPAWGTPSMWGSWRDQTAPGSSPALQENHMPLLWILKGGMYSFNTALIW